MDATQFVLYAGYMSGMGIVVGITWTMLLNWWGV